MWIERNINSIYEIFSSFQQVSEKPHASVIHEEDLIAMLETLKALQINRDSTSSIQSESK